MVDVDGGGGAGGGHTSSASAFMADRRRAGVVDQGFGIRVVVVATIVPIDIEEGDALRGDLICGLSGTGFGGGCVCCAGAEQGYQRSQGQAQG